MAIPEEVVDRVETALWAVSVSWAESAASVALVMSAE
jgi:hypothetical protein